MRTVTGWEYEACAKSVPTKSSRAPTWNRRHQPDCIRNAPAWPTSVSADFIFYSLVFLGPGVPNRALRIYRILAVATAQFVTIVLMNYVITPYVITRAFL